MSSCTSLRTLVVVIRTGCHTRVRTPTPTVVIRGGRETLEKTEPSKTSPSLEPFFLWTQNQKTVPSLGHKVEPVQGREPP